METKNKLLRKIMALALAGVMMLGMSTVAFAAGLGSDGTDAKTGVATGNETSLTVKKTIVVTNEQPSIQVSYPAVDLDFTVSSPTDSEINGAKVTDDQNPAVTVAVKPGPSGGVTATVTDITAGTITLDANGQAALQSDVTFAVTITAFEGPGVYRFKVTDSTDTANLKKAGIVRGSAYDTEYMLDVYTGWKDASLSKTNKTVADDLEVKGYVLTNTTASESITKDSDKESGFDNIDVNTDGTIKNKVTDFTTSDTYFTYNVTLDKEVTGTMGDTAHEFPFDLTITNQTKETSPQTLNYYVDGRVTAGATVASKAANANKVYIKSDDTDAVTIYGLNPYATVKYTETNDTSSTYTTTLKNGASSATTALTSNLAGTGTNASGTFTVAQNQTVIAYDTAAGIATWSDSEKATLTDAANTLFTNDLAAISPTGVVMRFAPYLIMMAGAIALVMFTRRRKAEEK